MDINGNIIEEIPTRDTEKDVYSRFSPWRGQEKVSNTYKDTYIDLDGEVVQVFCYPVTKETEDVYEGNCKCVRRKEFKAKKLKEVSSINNDVFERRGYGSKQPRRKGTNNQTIINIDKKSKALLKRKSKVTDNNGKKRAESNGEEDVTTGGRKKKRTKSNGQYKAATEQNGKKGKKSPGYEKESAGGGGGKKKRTTSNEQRKENTGKIQKKRKKLCIRKRTGAEYREFKNKLLFEGTSSHQLLLLIFLILVLAKKSQGDSEVGCPMSIETMSDVTNCPKSEREYEERVNRKNCSRIQHNCTINAATADFVYHCALNAWGDGIVEVCAPSRLILGRVCVEFNEGGGLVQRRKTKKCTKCPDIYNSTQAFKFTECYDIVSQNQHTILQTPKNNGSVTTMSFSSELLSTNSRTDNMANSAHVDTMDNPHRSVGFFMAGFGTSLLSFLLVISLLAWRQYKKREKCGKKIKRQMNEEASYSENGSLIEQREAADGSIEV